MTERVLYRAGDGPVHRIRPDLEGTVIDAEQATLVRWSVPAGRAPTPVHAHAEYEQISTVLAGSIETEVGGEMFKLKAGDVCHIRRGVPHGRTRALGDADAVVLDVFTPRREQYVASARREPGA